MTVVLADSNALRSPDLQSYLAAGPHHIIALSDLTLTEMMKTNALTTARQSLKVVSLFPAQTVVLRPTHELLNDQISSEADALRLVDDKSTADIRELSQALQVQLPPLSLALRMAAAERHAAHRHGLLRDQVALMEPGLVDVLRDFTREEIVQLRTAQGVTEATRDKLLALLKQTVRDFIVQNQEPDRRKPLTFGAATHMFAFRYSLCVVIYYLMWVQTGRQTGLNLERRVNDVVDLQVAALGTFFNGVVSQDRRLKFVSLNVRKGLRDWGAYVGLDLRDALARPA